jgi:hypothetical protein
MRYLALIPNYEIVSWINLLDVNEKLITLSFNVNRLTCFWGR